MEIIRIRTNHGDVIVWDICESVEELENNITLSVYESEYYNAISSNKRKKEWLISRIIVRNELGNNVTTEYKNQIPILIGSGRHISISHCDHMVAVYLSDVPCGIDIEDSTRNFDRVSSRFLSDKELSYISGSDIALAWGIKEAAYKRIGVSEIDFASMFKIKKIDREVNSCILSYNDIDYEFKFVTLNRYNIVY